MNSDKTTDTINKVIDLACEINHVRRDWVVSRRRDYKIVKVRHLIAYFLSNDLMIPRERFNTYLGYKNLDSRGFVGAGGYHAMLAFKELVNHDSTITEMYSSLKNLYTDMNQDIAQFYKTKAKEALKEIFVHVPVSEHYIIENFIHSYLI